MKLSKLLAIFGWINVFGLMWLMAIGYSPLQENRGFTVLTLTTFFIVTAVASAMQGK